VWALDEKAQPPAAASRPLLVAMLNASSAHTQMKGIKKSTSIL
jgi:hypothetical protein